MEIPIPKARAIREWTQFAILVFATGWGVYTFILRDVIRPAHRPTGLQVAATLGEVGRSDSDVLVTLQISCMNQTDRRVWIPAMWYTVRATTLRQWQGSVKIFRDSVEIAETRKNTAFHSRVTQESVAASGRIFVGESGLWSWYEPSDKTNNETFFTVPAGLYDALIVKVEYYVTRDPEDLATPSWVLMADGSWLANLMLKSDAGGDSFPDDAVSIAAFKAWEERTGAGYNWAEAGLSLWPH